METYQGAPLAEYFKAIEDPRIDRKKRYPLDELIVITVLAFLSGAEGWEDIWNPCYASQLLCRSILMRRP